MQRRSFWATLCGLFCGASWFSGRAAAESTSQGENFRILGFPTEIILDINDGPDGLEFVTSPITLVCAYEGHGQMSRKLFTAVLREFRQRVNDGHPEPTLNHDEVVAIANRLGIHGFSTLKLRGIVQ